ncbi:hypothetical protein A264_23268 [Pseudomonas syringae pv. actinidiae ICMP 19071]|uniref:NADH:ubiquinone oxidoreductase 49 kD subunit n=2 Tax=Pseudomonas syringae TaxID=317 RepID=A0A2V0QBF5_PSESF|nr:hypothetical protein [Pseudomonas syringae]EGH65460.1 hypothetical protein PSYAC_11221 [Pseudomonas syringae pv. actinidiae str. M302091]EPM57592.1 hypothetical protein A256_04454 [Pseudomonas syringae pv. actinidiae ICMP 19103]EPM62997.1 hypothetical protein A262_04370 [Pseudomonas syringae pv. actinidiae ICMP 19073]EPM75059.1 hypothetical protein A3SO_22979 [Pseudomonas syringae pv. actinidiae ICMP 19072]EPM89666.1 hypothetical protein A260_04268 [Pseudomonas syringae pv. actinidiae ICMP 
MMGSISQETGIIADTCFSYHPRELHMLTITTNTLGKSEISLIKDATKTESADQTALSSTDSQSVAVSEGVKVSLSTAGVSKSAAEGDPNRDIKDSNLPDNVKNTLIRIRELKQQIAERTAELQAVMADNSLSPQAKQVKVGSLQTMIAGLTAGLMTANSALEKASNSGVMTDDQVKQAAVLSMKS